MEEINEIIIYKAHDYKRAHVFRITLNLNRNISNNTLPKIKEGLHGGEKISWRVRICKGCVDRTLFSKPLK